MCVRVVRVWVRVCAVVCSEARGREGRVGGGRAVEGTGKGKGTVEGTVGAKLRTHGHDDVDA